MLPSQMPLQLTEQHRISDQPADHIYAGWIRYRLWISAATGLIATWVACIIPNPAHLPSHVPWLPMFILLLIGIAWSMAVEMFTLNHLISCVVFGLVSMARLWRLMDEASLFWWLALAINGALIGNINGTFRTHATAV
jgi:hypothetical protein